MKNEKFGKEPNSSAVKRRVKGLTDLARGLPKGLTGAWSPYQRVRAARGGVHGGGGHVPRT
eukprot:1196252-Prorocentrum_minimum.AAC.4